MRIAICEDDKGHAVQIEKFVLQHPNTKSNKVYYTADSLLTDYSSGIRYDIIFMDIQMDGVNGFQAAYEINKKYPDDKPLITFTTASSNYATMGYGIAWRYLVKPISLDIIHDCINQAVTELKRHIFLVKTKNGTESIDIKNIIYFDVNHGTVTIHTDGKIYVTKMTLKSVAEKLPSTAFFQAHRCYYVNLAHVSGFEGMSLAAHADRRCA